MRIHDLTEQKELPADTILIHMGVVKEEREVILEFLPLIPLALWGAGAAWTAYDTYKSKKQLDKGEITQAEFTKRVGTDVAITLLAGPTLKLAGAVGKGVWKGGKKIVSMVGGGAAKVGDEVADVSSALAKKIDDVPPVYSTASATAGSAATRAAVSNIDNVAIAARQAADKGATVAKNSSQAVTDIATANAAKTAAGIATKKAAQLAAKKAAQTTASDSRLIGLAAKTTANKIAAKKAAQTAASDSRLIGLAAKTTAKKIDNVVAKKVGNTVVKKVDDVVAKTTKNTVKAVDNQIGKQVVKKGGKRGSKWLKRMRGAGRMLGGGNDSGAGYTSNLQNVVKKYGY